MTIKRIDNQYFVEDSRGLTRLIFGRWNAKPRFFFRRSAVGSYTIIAGLGVWVAVVGR